MQHLEAQEMSAEVKTALWSLLDSKHRAAIKKLMKEAKDGK